MTSSARLQGKVAVVTGAADGIGLATARRFLEEGAAVLAADLSEARLRDALGEGHSRLQLVAQDVTAAQAPERLIDGAAKVFGGLDILVNNAGVVHFVPVETMSDDVWRRTLAVNIDAVFALCRRAIPHLRKSRAGRIINIASINAVRTGPGLGAYAATKHAVAGLTQTLAVELGADCITCNYVCPGAILTGMTRPLLAANGAVLESFSPLGRMGRPEEVAAAILFLASDDASFVNGHRLVVDGGFLPKL